MKNKNKNTRLILNIVSLITIASLFFGYGLLDISLFTALASDNGSGNTENAAPDVAGNTEQVFPYTKTFMITAYYSPLPGQKHYVTGSYESDIRLNGRGTNGADGTPVYAGMVAAPKTYPFGTKLSIPGIGMTAVHDRGGAIVKGKGDDPNSSGPKYDRLDIWMGYGDKGLTRALSWGFRTIEVTVYGIDDSIAESIELEGYSPDEKYNQEVFAIPQINSKKSYTSNTKNKPKANTELFPEDIWYLSEGDDVKKLQTYLKELGYFSGEIDGKFGDTTRMAVYLFQKDKGLVSDIGDLEAGHFGGATRKAFEEAVVSRKKNLIPTVTLNLTSTDKDSIKKLQNALKALGYNVEANGKYDLKTKHAVAKFQIDNSILKSTSDFGSGYFGPKTLTKLSAGINDLYKKGTISIEVVHESSEVNDMIESNQILIPPLNKDLKFGDKGPEVRRLQQELKNLNLLRIEPTGEYAEVTKHAVYKFQEINGIITDENSKFAGMFGPETRAKLNELIASKNYYNKKISDKKLCKNS